MTQAAFVAALMSPDAPVPPGLIDPKGRPARRRFDLYRNNVASSLVRVLQAGFPVVEKLVGHSFLAAMAGEFARAHPPTSRVMMLYGAEFPAFLSAFPPVAHLPYLPDVARLEQGLRQSYHAADRVPLSPDLLARMTPDALLSARISLAPSLVLLCSHWPVLSIWRLNQKGVALATQGPEDLVILRKEFDPEPLALPKGGAAVLRGLLAGQTVGQALDGSDDADLARLMTLLITHDAIAEIA